MIASRILLNGIPDSEPLFTSSVLGNAGSNLSIIPPSTYSLLVTSTGLPSRIGLAEFDLTASLGASDVKAALYAYAHQTSTAAGGNGHMIGALIRVDENGLTNAGRNLIAIEGKVEATGSAAAYVALSADANWQGVSFTGQVLYGLLLTAFQATTNGTVANATGLLVGVRVPTAIGGAAAYSFWGGDPLRNDGTITANNSGGANGTTISHSGVDGFVSTTLGHLWISPASGVVIANGSLLATSYLAADTSPGISTTVTTASLSGKTITIKNGLVTGFA